LRILVFSVFVGLAPVLGACAGSIVGDAIAGPEKLAQQDDAYCQAIGTRFGTPEYSNCRLIQQQTRETRHARGAAMAAAGAAIAASAAQPPTTTHCQRLVSEVICNTR
jgi:hypothetical protein